MLLRSARRRGDGVACELHLRPFEHIRHALKDGGKGFDRNGLLAGEDGLLASGRRAVEDFFRRDDSILEKAAGHAFVKRVDGLGG